MKNTRILAVVLALVMVLGCMAGFSFTSAAADEINLSLECAESMIMFTRGDKKDGITELTNGSIDDTDAGYWTLGGGTGYWCDDDGNALPVDENPAAIEVKLAKAYEITAINVGFLTPGECYSGDRYYHWEAYATNDNTLDISEWTKVAEKKTNEIADTDGHKVALTAPGTYQYIRIYGVYNSAIEDPDAWRGKFIHINEIEIWGPEPADKPVTLYPEKWTAPENGTNIILGNASCVVKSDRGNLPEMTDGIVGDKASDNYWSAGPAWNAPVENPIENESVVWFQANLDEVSEIDIIRVVTLLNDKAIYHWEIYATDDPEMALEGWDFIGEKKTDEISNEDGYAIYLDEPIEAKAVRVYCTKVSGNTCFQVTEIELWDLEEPSYETIEITPYAKGWENWTGGTGGEQTQLLITAPIVPDATTTAYTWEITIGDKTISLKSSSQYNFGNGSAIWRFETCLAEGDNQYIPENGTSGTVSAKIYNEAGELVYVAKAAADATWEVTMDPIVPAPPVAGPATITLTPKFGAWENWKNSPNKGDAEAVTQLLVGIQENGTTVDIDAALTWKLTIKGGDQEKTITLSPATKALAYDLYRFEVCLAEGDNQFVPVNGVEYTVTIEVYEGETLKYKSEPTAGFTCPMDPIVPTTEEPIDPPVDEPVDPPVQAGDAAVYATILVAVAAVALVVISKKRTNI